MEHQKLKKVENLFLVLDEYSLRKKIPLGCLPTLMVASTTTKMEKTLMTKNLDVVQLLRCSTTFMNVIVAGSADVSSATYDEGSMPEVA